jgi:hypothetical protein
VSRWGRVASTGVDVADPEVDVADPEVDVADHEHGVADHELEVRKLGGFRTCRARDGRDSLSLMRDVTIPPKMWEKMQEMIRDKQRAPSPGDAGVGADDPAPADSKDTAFSTLPGEAFVTGIFVVLAVTTARALRRRRWPSPLARG